VIFIETAISGAWVVELERREDERGSFARVFDADEFSTRGLDARIAQTSISVNLRAGTLRGLHLQVAPHGETKLVRCTRGAVFDVIVDLRPESPSYLRWLSAELDPEGGRMLYVPEGVAHGFQTLDDDTEVHYQITRAYVPSHASGVRWNDPDLGIEWPEAERTISSRDRALPTLVERG